MSQKVTSIFAALLVVFSFCAVGCIKNPLPKNVSRTPYDRYQILRGRERQAVRINEFGGEVPDINDRLKPLD